MGDAQTNETKQEAAAPRASSHIAGAIALLSLAIVAAAWLWTTHQPPRPEAGLGVPDGIIVVGAGAFVIALIAQIRSMSLWDVLEMLLEAVLGLLSLVGAALKGIWRVICGLLGWD